MLTDDVLDICSVASVDGLSLTDLSVPHIDDVGGGHISTLSGSKMFTLCLFILRGIYIHVRMRKR